VTEFDQTLGSKGVHIIDPFTGTGTFVTRLLQSGLIRSDELTHKYRHEIHANEIVLLAYYIAAINIEAVYHSIVGGEYTPFEGICLTDTFQLYEREDLISRLLEDNSVRRNRQKQLDIQVIISNPPYSIGQGSQNDNNQNVAYPNLDERITNTYAAHSNAALSKGLYDSYIRAIRWASDRVKQRGIVGFVTNAGFVEANTADGLRKCLAEEFSSLYVFHLRGNQRTQGELSRKEGGKIFGSGSRAPIAITFLVKNPSVQSRGQIYFYDIGDYLTREEKLAKLVEFRSIAGGAMADGWRNIVPDAHGDWLKQRDSGFDEFIVVGDKRGVQRKIFDNFSMGVATNRDAWCFNFARSALADNMQRMIAAYNRELARFSKTYAGVQKNARIAAVDKFVDADPTKISWTVALKQDLTRERRFGFEPDCLTPSLYRPFTKQWLYFNRHFNERVLQMPRIFPNAKAENIVIMIKQRWSGNGQLALMVDCLPELQIDGGTQCFPLYLYDEPLDEGQVDLFAQPKKKQNARRDAITDEGLAHFRAAYPGEELSKEDIFYYVYGLLHSSDYRSRYADNLGKELPRIPCVTRAATFRAISKAGRRLSALHVGYETVAPHPVTVESQKNLRASDYRVEKMRYGKVKVDGKTVDDKTVLIYNEHITLRDIPVEAYEYVVNGKSALDWVVERQCVKTEKDSGIVNDANDWANETMNNPKYPLELFQRVITVSLETLKIVASLPGLEI
jgi:predicted helicase